MTLDERNQEINQVLDARFNQLNAAIEAHEAKLKKMMVARDAEVMYNKFEDTDDNMVSSGQYQYYLGMIKQRGEWRLCHGTCYESYCGGPPDEGIDWKPLVEASVDYRINAADHVEELREAIVQSKEELVPELEKAIETLAKSLD